MPFLIAGLKWPRTEKDLGIIYSEQMVHPDSKEWLLPRINPCCENCNNNNYYKIIKSYYKPLIVLPIGALRTEYRNTCPECNETIVLDPQEFWKVKPFLRLNKKKEKGLVEETEFQSKLEDLYKQ